MPYSHETRASTGGRQTGTAWVHGALARLIGEMPDLRKGLRTPEEMTATEAAPIIERLTQTFQKQLDPATQRTSFVVRAPRVVIDGGASGLFRTGGALVALQERTKRTIEDSLTAIERIEPLDQNADRRELKLTKSIVRSSLEALLREVQQEPRPFQMDALFESILGPKTDAGKYKEGAGYLGQLQRIAGLGASKARLSGDYEQYTRFLLVRHSVESLSDAWDHWRREAQDGDLGLQFVRVTWLFQAIRETVAMFREELDEIGLGDATRWTMQMSFDAKGEEPLAPVSLGAFLDIIDTEAERWNQLIDQSGAVAAGAIREFVGNLRELVRRARPDFMVQEKPFPERSYAATEKPDLKHEVSHPAKGGGYGVKTRAARPTTTTVEVDHLRAAFETAEYRLAMLLEEIENELRTPEAAVPYEDRSTL